MDTCGGRPGGLGSAAGDLRCQPRQPEHRHMVTVGRLPNGKYEWEERGS
jgi:hypothetical protein